MEKKALSHVEVVLSFVLFLGFLFFMFIIINPLSKTKNTSVLDIASFNFVQKNSIQLTKVSIKTPPGTGGCFKINTNEFNCDKKILTKNFNNIIIKSEISSPNILIEKSGDFYNLYCSEEFNEKRFSRTCNPASINYSIGVIREDNLLSNKKIAEFITLYDTDYDSAKKTLKIPGNLDFEFTVRNSTQQIIFSGKRDKAVTSRVSSKEKYIEIIDENADIKSGLLSIKIW